LGVSYNPKIITDGLVFCVDAANGRSYPKTGTTLSDLVASYNGTFVNMDASNFDEANGGSLVFDGTNEYITTSGMENFSYPNGITISIWHFNEGTINYRGVINNGTSSPYDRLGGFDLRYGRENYFGGTNNGTFLFLRITNANSQGSYLPVYSNLNEWHNYTFTYDNTTIIAYKDGVFFDSVNHAWGGQLKTTTSSPLIGHSLGTGEYLDGKLSSILIYDRPLIESEILQNYNATKGRYK